MGFLNPLFLLAGASIAVPLILHLWHRQESKDVRFPAIRYLLDTEREHAKRIRARQLLLLLLRIAILVVVVLVGARLFVPGSGGTHEPTALVLILDNSMSSGLVQDGAQKLDELKSAALSSVQATGPDDVVWVIRAGEPNSAALPGNASSAETRIRETQVSGGHGNLTWALRRARGLVASSPLEGKEIHVFSDLQASAFPTDRIAGPSGEGPAVAISVFGASVPEEPNRSIAEVLVGGGLPPLAGQRTEAVVDVQGSGEDVGVRVYIDDQVRGATQAPPGSSVPLALGPFNDGRINGYIELDPDPLSADDRRYFSFDVRQPTPFAVTGPPTVFLTEGLGVLVSDGRAREVAPNGADVLVAIEGLGLEQRASGQRVLVFPPADPTRLPALNRRLSSAGIPVRYEPASGQRTRIDTHDLRASLNGVEVTRFHPMSATLDDQPVESRATLGTGDAWIISGSTAEGPFLLFGSPLEPTATTLPVSAAMIPVMEWAVDYAAQGSSHLGATAGEAFSPPSGTTFIEAPSGERFPVDQGQPFSGTNEPGFYRAFVGDSLAATYAVNTPAAESDLTRLSDEGMSEVFGPEVRFTEDLSRWPNEIFRQGQGPEPWRFLLFVLLGLLIAETIVRASERLRGGTGSRDVIDPSQPEAARA